MFMHTCFSSLLIFVPVVAVCSVSFSEAFHSRLMMTVVVHKSKSERKRKGERERERERERETDRQTDRQTDRERETERQKQADREWGGGRERA